MNARLDWRTVASPAALTADLDWRGRRQQFVLWVSQPVVAAARQRLRPSRSRPEAPKRPSTMAGNGRHCGEAPFRRPVSDRDDFAARSFVVAWSRCTSLPTVTQRDELEGDLSQRPSSATITNLRLVTGDETFEGTLALQTVPRPSAAFRHAGDAFVSLAPYLATRRR